MSDTPDPASSPSPPSGRERRRHPRSSLDCPLTISMEDGYHEGRLRDVSRAGVCFFLDRPVPEMTVLGMQFDLPENGNGKTSRIEGTGVVVRCLPLSPAVDHYEIAVFLNDITEMSRDRLAAFVAQHVGGDPGPSEN